MSGIPTTFLVPTDPLPALGFTREARYILVHHPRRHGPCDLGGRQAIQRVGW